MQGHAIQLIRKNHLTSIAKYGNRKIGGIPNFDEHFMTFSVCVRQFIAPFQFIASSLDRLVRSLYEEQ